MLLTVGEYRGGGSDNICIIQSVRGKNQIEFDIC